MTKCEFEELADAILEDVYSPLLADQDALKERIVSSMAQVQATLTARIGELASDVGPEAAVEALCKEVMLDHLYGTYDLK